MGEEKDLKSIQEVAMKGPWAFLAVFLVIFFVLCVFLYAIDFVPEPPVSSKALQDGGSHELEEVWTVEQPERVVIPAIGVDTPVENPSSTDIAVLDEALLRGAVRYPRSALLGENATMFLFAHQSYLPVVRNQAFKAFNDLQRLTEGDLIQVSSATAEYEYRVQTVEKVRAEEGLVSLKTGSRTLVLSTCNSFGKNPEERYVVTAEFVHRIARAY